MSLDDQVFEDQVAQSLRDAGEELTPRDLTGLVNGGVADGRKRRRRRNVAVLGGSAALALVAVGGAMVPSLLNTSGGSRNVAGVAAQPNMSLSASAKPVSSADMERQVLAALESVLPAGGKVSDTHSNWTNPVDVARKTGNLASGNASAYKYKNVMAGARLLYTDGKGATDIGVTLTKYSTTQGPGQLCGQHPIPNDTCTTYQLPGGGQMQVDIGLVYTWQPQGVKEWSAWVFLPDGSEIGISEVNSTQEKLAPITRAVPALSADQLKAAVQSDVWTPLLAQIPRPQPFHPTGTPGPKGGPNTNVQPQGGTAH